MYFWLLGCWKNVSQVVPHEEAQKWNEQIVVESNEDVLQIDVRVGSASDPVGKEGLAYLTAHMIFPSALGVEIDIERERTRFRIPVPASKEESIINQVLDCLVNPMWSEQRQQQLTEESLAHMTDWSVSTSVPEDIFELLLYSGHPYGHFPFGGQRALSAINNIDLHNFYAQYFIRSSILLGWDGKAYRRAVVEKVQVGLSSLPTYMPKYKTPVSLSVSKDAYGMYLFDEEHERNAIVWGSVVPQATKEQRMVALIVNEYMCPTASMYKRDTSIRVYDPIIMCSELHKGDDETLAALERYSIRYQAIHEESDDHLQGVQARVLRKLRTEHMELAFHSELFSDFSVLELEPQMIRNTLKEISIHRPKILVISSQPQNFSREIEDLLDFPVYFLDSPLESFTK